MADKLDDPHTAYAYAGFDTNFTFFKLYTRKLFDPIAGESGQFVVEYQNNILALEKSSDPVGFLKAAARIMVANSVKETGVDVTKWIVEFSPVMEKFNIPSHLYLDTTRDRAWLA